MNTPVKFETAKLLFEKEFVSYNQALRLKELGFDEPCFAYYNKKQLFSFTQVCNEPIKGHYIKMSNRLCTPTFSQAFRWFREKHQISPSIHCMSEQGNSWRYHIPNEGGENNFSTYEEAELACLDKLIEIVESKSE